MVAYLFHRQMVDGSSPFPAPIVINLEKLCYIDVLREHIKNRPNGRIVYRLGHKIFILKSVGFNSPCAHQVFLKRGGGYAKKNKAKRYYIAGAIVADKSEK